MTLVKIKREDIMAVWQLHDDADINELYTIFESAAIALGYQKGSIEAYFYEQSKHIHDEMDEKTN